MQEHIEGVLPRSVIDICIRISSKQNSAKRVIEKLSSLFPPVNNRARIGNIEYIIEYSINFLHHSILFRYFICYFLYVFQKISSVIIFNYFLL